MDLSQWPLLEHASLVAWRLALAKRRRKAATAQQFVVAPLVLGLLAVLFACELLPRTLPGGTVVYPEIVFAPAALLAPAAVLAATALTENATGMLELMTSMGLLPGAFTLGWLAVEGGLGLGLAVVLSAVSSLGSLFCGASFFALLAVFLAQYASLLSLVQAVAAVVPSKEAASLFVLVFQAVGLALYVTYQNQIVAADASTQALLALVQPIGASLAFDTFRHGAAGNVTVIDDIVFFNTTSNETDVIYYPDTYYRGEGGYSGIGLGATVGLLLLDCVLYAAFAICAARFSDAGGFAAAARKARAAWPGAAAPGATTRRRRSWNRCWSSPNSGRTTTIRAWRCVAAAAAATPRAFRRRSSPSPRLLARSSPTRGSPAGPRCRA